MPVTGGGGPDALQLFTVEELDAWIGESIPPAIGGLIPQLVAAAHPQRLSAEPRS